MIRSLIIVPLSSIALTASFRPASVYAQPINQNVRCMEGVYALEEFGKDGVVYRSPQVSGRYMLRNGAVFWIFHDRTQQSKQTSTAAFGHYKISEGAYAYQLTTIRCTHRRMPGLLYRVSFLGKECDLTCRFSNPMGRTCATATLGKTFSVRQMA
jgi:hypothetical protein